MRKKTISNVNPLMEGFRAGQHKCFTEVFNVLYAPLCYYATKITHDQAAAEDIVEDSFIKIWAKRDIFFEMNVLKSYLYTAVKNASINWNMNSNKTISLTDNLLLNELSDHPHTFNYVVGSQVYSELNRALEKLSPQGKQIIKMIFFDGKNIREVAEHLGVSQSTIKTQKGRSLHKLKKNIVVPNH